MFTAVLVILLFAPEGDGRYRDIVGVYKTMAECQAVLPKAFSYAEKESPDRYIAVCLPVQGGKQI